MALLDELFLREKPAKIFLGLKTAKDKSTYATILSKQAECTYSHTVKILGNLQKLGLVEFEKTGRIKKVRLTDDGLEIANNLDAIVRKFGQLEDQIEKQKKEQRKQAKEAQKWAPFLLKRNVQSESCCPLQVKVGVW